MKRRTICSIAIVCLVTICTGTALVAKEYSYLAPPTISVMDFEVNIEEFAVNDTVLNRNYYGELINHALVTVLIRKNASTGIEIELAKYFPPEKLASVLPVDRKGAVVLSESNMARYFPPLLKIYDKKYVEKALEENNYGVPDLYTKSPEAFDFTALDFVVLGNVFETVRERPYIGLNVRLLNTYRAEELYSYTGFIRRDLSNLYEVCEDIAERIIIDILKNYCSQLIVKETDTVPEETPYTLFLQSRQEKDNVNSIITTNDTYKKDISRDTFYWILPGDYILTLYNEVSKAVREIPVTIGPREIKLVSLVAEHFEVERGSLTIGGIFPVDAYSFQLTEKQKDAEYIWEIGKDLGSILQDIRFTFRGGEFDSASEAEDGPTWSYNPARNEILVEDMMISRYDVRMTPVAESVSKESITGIVRLSSRAIETSEPVLIDLETEKDTVLDVADFGMAAVEGVTPFETARVTFLMHPAFSGTPVEIWVKDGFREGYLLLQDTEKLIVESEYSQEEWESLLQIRYELRQGLRYFRVDLPTEKLTTRYDRIVIVDFRKAMILPKIGRLR
jgi:hypothetical protein